MMLAGLSVPDRLVLDLIGRLREAGFEDTATTLDQAYDREAKILALSITDREAILRALEDCPDGFGELRSVLTREHEWRKREGLV
jgi:hypothetical protein